MKSGGEGQDPKPSNNNTPSKTNQNSPQNGSREGTNSALNTPRTSAPSTPQKHNPQDNQSGSTPRTTAPNTPVKNETSAKEEVANNAQDNSGSSVPNTPQSISTQVPNATPKVEISPAASDKDEGNYVGMSPLSKDRTDDSQSKTDSVSFGNGHPPQLILTSEGTEFGSNYQEPSTPGHTPYLGVLDQVEIQPVPPEELEPDEPNPFRLFTPESYERLLIREEEEKRTALEKKNRPAEGRLVDGELKFDDEEEDGPPMERDPMLMEGNSLPEHLAEIFPPEYYTKPIEDVDQYIKAKVSSNFYTNSHRIKRLMSLKSQFNIQDPPVSSNLKLESLEWSSKDPFLSLAKGTSGVEV